MFGNQFPLPNRKWLTYLEIQLLRQSVWKGRCPDKCGSTVLIVTFTVLNDRGIYFCGCLFQDIPYFDDHNNRVGALTSRLSSDATLIQGVSLP